MRSYPGADCGSGNHPVACTMKVRVRKAMSTTKMLCNLLRKIELQARYAVAIQKGFNVLENEQVRIVEAMKKPMLKSAKEII